LSHKAELARDNEESRKKMAELEKKYKAIEKKNAEFNFVLEKEHAKWTMEKDGLLDRITELEQIISDKAAMERSMDKQIKSPKASIDRRLPEPF
jgi:chromosome segregation ATPase